MRLSNSRFDPCNRSIGSKLFTPSNRLREGHRAKDLFSAISGR
jgi:hypothetical protein